MALFQFLFPLEFTNFVHKKLLVPNTTTTTACTSPSSCTRISTCTITTTITTTYIPIQNTVNDGDQLKFNLSGKYL